MGQFGLYAWLPVPGPLQMPWCDRRKFGGTGLWVGDMSLLPLVPECTQYHSLWDRLRVPEPGQRTWVSAEELRVTGSSCASEALPKSTMRGLGLLPAALGPGGQPLSGQRPWPRSWGPTPWPGPESPGCSWLLFPARTGTQDGDSPTRVVLRPQGLTWIKGQDTHWAFRNSLAMWSGMVRERSQFHSQPGP